MITQQEIQDTLNHYADHDNGSSAYDELEARTIEAMHLVREVRLILDAAMMETATPKNQSPFRELAIASDKLGYVLTIFD